MPVGPKEVLKPDKKELKFIKFLERYVDAELREEAVQTGKPIRIVLEDSEFPERISEGLQQKIIERYKSAGWSSVEFEEKDVYEGLMSSPVVRYIILTP